MRRPGVAAFAAAARLAETAFSPPPRRPARDYLGAQLLGARAFFGVALPFGRISAEALGEIAALAQDAGAETVRLTPWRAILVPGLSAQAARALAGRARRLDLILDPDDPRLRVAACPGAPACSSALGDTRAAAMRLAPFATRALHVSGCAKGCAHPGPAPFTIIATAAGYDLVRDGSADAAPLARGLSVDALAQQLAALAPRNESAA